MKNLKWEGLPVVIFGSGGISKEVYTIIEEVNRKNNAKVYDFLGFVEENQDSLGREVIQGYQVVSYDGQFGDYASKYPVLGVIIPNGNPKIKALIYEKISKIENLVFPNIIHPRVIMDNTLIEIGIGNIICAGVNLTCDIRIGNFNLINLNTTIGHDTFIGNFNVVNPLSSISGNVKIHDKCLIGTGANLLQNITVKDNATVGAGAVVIKDVDEGITVVGIPAKELE